VYSCGEVDSTEGFFLLVKIKRRREASELSGTQSEMRRVTIIKNKKRVQKTRTESVERK
jgi:hypothetical protein